MHRHQRQIFNTWLILSSLFTFRIHVAFCSAWRQFWPHWHNSRLSIKLDCRGWLRLVLQAGPPQVYPHRLTIGFQWLRRRSPPTAPAPDRLPPPTPLLTRTSSDTHAHLVRSWQIFFLGSYGRFQMIWRSWLRPQFCHSSRLGTFKLSTFTPRPPPRSSDSS